MAESTPQSPKRLEVWNLIFAKVVVVIIWYRQGLDLLLHAPSICTKSDVARVHKLALGCSGGSAGGRRVMKRGEVAIGRTYV